MMEPDRVLRPLQEARPAIERLDTYESPAALTDALRATWHALDRTLRLLLRNDPGAPDPVRLSALSEELPLDDVITALRRRELLTLSLAGRIHELGQAVRRAETDGVRAADADNGIAVVHALEAEVRALARVQRQQPAWDAADRSAHREAERTVSSAWSEGVESVESRRAWRLPPRVALLVGSAVLVLVIAVVAVVLLGRDGEMERGMAAFSAGRSAAAEQHFRNVLRRDEDNVSARLYLARILRGQNRSQEAAELLRAAARLAPRDPAVRRELGYLFLSLNRAPNAVEQFRQAVELAPEEPLGWVGLVESMRRAGDPAAEEWLRRAPAEAQAMVRTGRRPGGNE